MNRRVFVSTLLVLAAVASFAAPAFAQQAAAYTNELDSSSDVQGWYLYAYPNPFTFEVDSTPIGGVSGASLNFNNGTDVDYFDWCYGYDDTDQSPFNVQGLDSPILSFWCKADLGPTSNYYQYREVGMYDYPNWNYYFYFDMGDSNAFTIDCGTSGDWHQHLIPIDPGIVAVGSLGMWFYFYGEPYGQAAGYEGWFIDRIQFLVADITPPDAISDLAAANPTLTEMELSWTSPTDDDISGVTASFDLRMSTSPINEANFGSATQLNGEPNPDVPGTLHTVLVTGLIQDTTYYFAIRTTDIAGNVSLISNVPSLATLAPPPPPPPPPSAGLEEPKDPTEDDILPCSAGASAAPTGLLALAGLFALAFALRRKA